MMNVSDKHMFALLMLATVLHSSQAAYNVTAVCTLTQPGTKLPSTSSCPEYFVCNSNGTYSEASCPENEAFDKNGQKCSPSKDVNCYYGMANPCINAESKSFVPIQGCGKYAYCLDHKVAGEGKCPNGLVFKDGECKYGTCLDSEGNGMDSIDICSIIPDDTYFGTTFSCDQYQICPAGKAMPTVGTCFNDLVFDVKIGLCNYPETTDCSRVTGDEIPGTGGSGVEACLLNGGLKANQKKCSGYFRCDGTKWVSQSCGSMYWDTLTSKCMQRQKATPAQDCDRCEGFNGLFVNAVNETCAEYYVCSNGKKTFTGSCEKGYFDEAAQACMSNDMLPAYAAANGACHKAPAPCTCDVPDSKTGKCSSTADCKCGLNGSKKTECIVCSDPIDPATGICQNGACLCDKRSQDKCWNRDDCNCALDKNQKCITCEPNDISAQGVCEAAPAPTCDCASRAMDNCWNKDECNCAVDEKDDQKCITCEPNKISAQGVCEAAPAPTCDCASRAMDNCWNKDECNCAVDEKDDQKCITCEPNKISAQGVCEAAPAPTCDCASRAMDNCWNKDECNCAVDEKDDQKCITCEPNKISAQGVCEAAPAPTCDCASRAMDNCWNKDECNCAVDEKDDQKCITCEPNKISAQGVCEAAPAPTCDCASRAMDNCWNKDECNCAVDEKDDQKCITCEPNKISAQGVCGTA